MYMNTISGTMDLQQFASLVAAARKRNNDVTAGIQKAASVPKSNVAGQIMKSVAETRNTSSLYGQNTSMVKTSVRVSGTKFDAYA
jgi:hypothetical protein